MINLSKREPRAIARFGGIFSCSCSCYLVPFGHMSPDVSLVLRYTVVSMSHVISAGTKGQHIRPLWPLLRLGSKIMLLRMGLLLRLGSKCYYGWDFYYAWVQMLLQMGPLLHLGPVITLVPSQSIVPERIKCFSKVHKTCIYFRFVTVNIFVN